eukprot:Lithocolla_globosa_v1_NODE_1341_length_2657_cov_21.132104.p1 type:complete len:359 gc:universal NODE_1341_length_2657_cov_21.132104:2315-1239(-)
MQSIAKPVTLSKLRQLYKDPTLGLVGQKAFTRNLDSRNIKYDPTLISKLFEDPAQALNKPAPKHFPRRRVHVPGIDYTWGMDLIFLPGEASYNDGLKAFLIVIDFFSKYAWVRPVTDTKSATISKQIRDILKTSGRKPQNVNTDRGSEFKLETIKLFKELGINHYFSNNETKVPIAERFARTLKNRIAKYEDTHQTNRFIDALPEIVKGYNNTRHSSIKMTPLAASKPENQIKVYHNLYGDIDLNEVCKPKYKEGDYVLISVRKGMFEKESTHKWSPEVFQILQVKQTVPCTYILKDLSGQEILGSFYEPEMQLTTPLDDEIRGIDEILKRRTVRKQKQVLVKWKDGTKEWILEDDLL